jgi:hypothetical protein
MLKHLPILRPVFLHVPSLCMRPRVVLRVGSWELTDKNGQPNPIGQQVASGFTNAQGIFYIQEFLTPAEFSIQVDAAPNFNIPTTFAKVGRALCSVQSRLRVGRADAKAGGWGVECGYGCRSLRWVVYPDPREQGRRKHRQHWADCSPWHRLRHRQPYVYALCQCYGLSIHHPDPFHQHAEGGTRCERHPVTCPVRDRAEGGLPRLTFFRTEPLQVQACHWLMLETMLCSWLAFVVQGKGKKRRLLRSEEDMEEGPIAADLMNDVEGEDSKNLLD